MDSQHPSHFVSPMLQWVLKWNALSLSVSFRRKAAICWHVAKPIFDPSQKRSCSPVVS